MEVLMKLLLTILALAAFALAQEAPAPAAAPAPEKKAEKKAPKAKVVELKGTVVSVDAVANTVVVKTETGEETLNVEKTTKILAGKKAVALADLKAETAVVCKVKDVDGKKVAVSIAEKAEKKGAAKKEAAPAEAPAAAPAAAPATK
jgi:hypothetical protein